jgi:hypothetical protein
MICFAKPGLTEGTRKNFQWHAICAIRAIDKGKRSLFLREKPILSLERMLHKDCERKGSVAKKKSLVVILKGLGPKANCLAVNRQS